MNTLLLSAADANTAKIAAEIIKSGGKFLSACAKKPFSKVFEGVYDSFTKFVKLNKLFLVIGFYFAEAFGAPGKRFGKKFSADVPDKAIVLKFRGVLGRNRENTGF